MPIDRKKAALIAAAAAIAVLGGAYALRDSLPSPAAVISKLGIPQAQAPQPAAATPAADAAQPQKAPDEPAKASPDAAAQAKGPVVSGPLNAVAGDRLAVKVALKDVASPSVGDTCVNAQGQPEDIGIQARTATGLLIGTDPVSCVLEGGDGVCTLRDGTVLNKRIVEMGWGIGEHGSPYWDATVQAKAAKRGLWGVCPTMALPVPPAK